MDSINLASRVKGATRDTFTRIHCFTLVVLYQPIVTRAVTNCIFIFIFNCNMCTNFQLFSVLSDSAEKNSCHNARKHSISHKKMNILCLPAVTDKFRHEKNISFCDALTKSIRKQQIQHPCRCNLYRSSKIYRQKLRIISPFRAKRRIRTVNDQRSDRAAPEHRATIKYIANPIL